MDVITPNTTPPTAKFTELATGIVVEVETPFTWGSDAPQFHVVRYESGRAYVVPDALLSLHFAVVTPQKIRVRSFGGVDTRPTAKQRETEAAR